MPLTVEPFAAFVWFRRGMYIHILRVGYQLMSATRPTADYQGASASSVVIRSDSSFGW